MKAAQIREQLDYLVEEDFRPDEPTEWDDALCELHQELGAPGEHEVVYAAAQWVSDWHGADKDWTPEEFAKVTQEGFRHAQGRDPGDAYRQYVENVANPEREVFIREYGDYIDWETYAADEDPDVDLVTEGDLTFVFSNC